MAEEEFENPVYLIEFIYTSGAKVRYWLSTFKITDGNAEWKMVTPKIQALHLNLDEVESIHQLDIKEADDLRDPSDTRLSWER